MVEELGKKYKQKTEQKLQHKTLALRVLLGKSNWQTVIVLIQ